MIRLKALTLATLTAALIIISASVLSFVTESVSHASPSVPVLPTPLPTFTGGPLVVPAPGRTPIPSFTGGPLIVPAPNHAGNPAAANPVGGTSNPPRDSGVQQGANGGGACKP